MRARQRGGLTPKKDLHDHASLWHDSAHRTLRATALTRDVECKVAVVGAGITGALTALLLTDAGHDVVILDRRAPGSGSTVASTAMIQFEIDQPLTALSKRIGPRKAQRVYQRSFQAVRDLSDLIADHRLRARWEDRPALYLAGNTFGHRALQDEARARQRLGLPSEYLDGRTIENDYRIERTGGILSRGSAELDPAQTCASCLKRARELGARLYVPVNVTGIEAEGKMLRLSTEDGPAVTCRKVVFATGYEVVDGVPRDSFDIVSSWAIATKPVGTQDFWPERCLIWEASDPYLYVRSARDNRILVGGEDSGLTDPKRRASAIANKSRTLLDKARSLLGLPGLEIDYAWAGAFAENPKGLPVFKALENIPGAYAILGCGGNGITFSVIGGQIVERWVAGKHDPDAELFAA